ncbi:MAG: DUF4407 domain-containing protein [Bacteroidetes bacterium]|nr:MAG: DUF4407 domain-containing protein [Bacteroidota bacterium]
MSSMKRFFLFCSGIDQSILQQCPTDDNKYLGIGGTIFFTGVLAFFSSAYALYTVFDNWVAAATFGLVWGLMIFNLDRYIVSSMKSKGGFFGNFFMALPRIVLAVMLALVISKPLELKIFEKEINAEVLVMEQEKFKEQEDLIKERYAVQLASYQQTLEQLQTEITQRTATRDGNARAALQEADGSGGSNIRNMGPIYRAKQAAADQAQLELDATLARNLPLITETSQTIKALDEQVKTDITTMGRTAFGGLAARAEALSRLAVGSKAIKWASLFVMLLFVMVETSPILVKLISPRSPYDHLLAELEQQFELTAKEKMDLRSHEVLSRLREHTEVGLHQTRADIKIKKAEIDADLQRRLDALRKSGYLVE